MHLVCTEKRRVQVLENGKKLHRKDGTHCTHPLNAQSVHDLSALAKILKLGMR